MRLVGPGFIAAHVVALHVIAFWFRGSADDAPFSATADDAGEPTPAEGAPATPGDEAPRPAPAPVPRPGPLELDKVREEGEHFVADLGNGWTADLTTEPKLQKAAERALKMGRVPMGAVVVVDVASGNVLAMAERLEAGHEAVPPMPEGPAHMALRAVAPAASVFKIVTAAALLEAGVSSEKAFCFREASNRIDPEHIKAPAVADHCETIGRGLAKSTNGLFARLALDHLDRSRLDLAARRFGFNQVIPFPLVNEASTANIPRNDLDLARAAAGFWHTRLTPLHGALLAAAVAGDGRLPSPQFVARLHSPNGEVMEAPRQAPFTTAMSPEVAGRLRRMLRDTVDRGTARRAFAQAADDLSGLSIAGKTGSLTATNPVTAYTWFVGFAPADKPEIAFAVMVGNGSLWWMKASDVAREVVVAWNRDRQPETEAPAVARR